VLLRIDELRLKIHGLAKTVTTLPRVRFDLNPELSPLLITT
jgi:hypothetical protein